MPIEWTPFRPNEEDLKRLDREVAAMPAIQEKLVARHDGLKLPDRVAHHYQVAGGKVLLEIADELPEDLAGIGLFEPGARHIGINRRRDRKREIGHIDAAP